MCDPVSAALGAGQAISAVGSYSSQVSQTNAKNQQILANYNQRKASYEKGNLDRLAIYQAKVADTIVNQDEIGLAASRAISSNSLAEAEADRQLEAKLQQIQISKLRGAATNEGGRARSYGKNRIRETGRAEGAIAGQRERLSVASFIAERQAIENANQERIQQWRSVNLGPGEAGPAPEMPKFLKGPSKLGLAISLAGAAVTAAAPAFAKTPTPTPGPTPPTDPGLMSGFVPSTGSIG